MVNNTKHSEKKQMRIKSPHSQVHTGQWNKTTATMPRALALFAIILFLCSISLFYILFQNHSATGTKYACIYQNGILIQTIDLSAITESYSFTIEGPDSSFNTISVRPGAIGISDADCPDKLCVSMGYADSSLLPIVCLPHSLVIQVEEKKEETIDGMTY